MPYRKYCLNGIYKENAIFSPIARGGYHPQHHPTKTAAHVLQNTNPLIGLQFAVGAMVFLP